MGHSGGVRVACDIQAIRDVVVEDNVTVVDDTAEKLPGVYGIQAGDNGPIKIGESADVLKRIRSLRTGHHEALRIVYFDWQADRVTRKAIERRLHQQFRGRRLRGEWFSADILPELEEIQFPAELIRTRIDKNYDRAIEILNALQPQSPNTTE